jgi:hypothetical protein
MTPLRTRLFERHLRETFVETGTNKGYGIALALACGYKNVISVECDPEPFDFACRLYHGKEQVKIWFGDSVSILPFMLMKLNYPATFWIDAHDPAKGKCSALEELQIINRFEIKNHTIMIDDWEDFGTLKHGNITKESIIEALRRINPNYFISCHYAEVGAPNILVAEI